MRCRSPVRVEFYLIERELDRDGMQRLLDDSRRILAPDMRWYLHSTCAFRAVSDGEHQPEAGANRIKA